CGAPIVMTSGSWRLPSREGRASHAEAVLAVLGFTALSVYIFFVGKVPISGSFPYPVYPFVVWVALRMGPPVVSLLTPILAAIAVAATRAGAGPFTDGEAFTRIGRAQTFVVILALTGMTLAAAVRERASVSAERAWLADVTDRSLNEIYVFDPSTLRFEYFNAGARANTGYTPEKIREMTPIDIKPEFDERSFRALIAPLLEGSTRQLRFETIHLRADGTTYPVEVYLQLVDRGGRPVFVALINDISQRRQTEVALAEYRDHLEGLVDERTEELQQANEELEVSNEELHSLYEDTAEAAEELARLNREVEEASRAKSDFLANMSHELRTPLNSIIGFSDILLHGLAGPLTKEQARQVAMINDSGKHLLDLINDVLDLSKIEAERMEPVFEVCDLSAVTRQVVESVEPQAHEKGLYLEWSGLDCQTPVLTDATMVRQIVLNLLSNALKFTQRGGIRVGLTLEEGWCRISVSDTGPGIADADRRRIFESFTQLPAANGGRPDGTGLGLSISARLAGLLGGRIELTNAAERGSTFTVVLPTQ
ncbi:MAG: ATP-binding protein, partial [Coriobacteriales bacterium]